MTTSLFDHQKLSVPNCAHSSVLDGQKPLLLLFLLLSPSSVYRRSQVIFQSPFSKSAVTFDRSESETTVRSSITFTDLKPPGLMNIRYSC